MNKSKLFLISGGAGFFCGIIAFLGLILSANYVFRPTVFQDWGLYMFNPLALALNILVPLVLIVIGFIFLYRFLKKRNIPKPIWLTVYFAFIILAFLVIRFVISALPYRYVGPM